MSLLTITDLCKNFGGLRALSDISFQVKAGACTGLVGANGAGKTTLFSVIAGHQSPTSGSIHFDGRAIAGKSPDYLCRAGISRSFQIVRPLRALSVLDNVKLAAMFGQGLSDSLAEKFARQVVDDCGLSQRREDPAGTLTLALQKRLELARCLGSKPRLILLDEVMAGLTAPEVAEVAACLTRIIKDYDLTMLIVEHNTRVVMELADNIIVLHHGTMLAQGAPDQILANQQVQSVYFGEDA